MISKNLYLQIAIRVVLIVVAALVTGWALFQQKSYVLSIVSAGVLLLSSSNLIYYLNTINRRIYYFFDAIKNEDSSLRFPENPKNKIIKKINESLEEVNLQIRDKYIENQKQEQYFQALLEHAATGLFTFNKKGFVLHSNKLAKKLFGLEVLTHINQLQRVSKKLFQTIQEIKPWEQYLVSIQRAGGIVQLLVKTNSFYTDNEELMLVSVNDIRNELDEKELDSWRKLIKVMMHEIMNSIAPLTSLSGSLVGYFSEHGKMKTPAQINEKTIETTLKGLEVIREQGKGLISFVESYRKITHLPSPQKKVFRVKKLIDNIRILSETFENSGEIEFTCEVKPPELELVADEVQISQVLLNLIKNAFQAFEKKSPGKVKILAQVSVSGRPEIHVTDNGQGIPTDLMNKIFIPFFTTKKSGSGIGLSVSRQIMQMHGGQLHITSEEGKFTSAVLSF